MCRRLQACLDIDPEKRLTCTELLRLPYLTGVEATIPAAVLKAQVGHYSCKAHALHDPATTPLASSPSECHELALGMQPRSLRMDWSVQEKAAEERDMLVKLRRQKRKSADLEPEAAARPSVSPHSVCTCITSRTLPGVLSTVPQPSAYKGLPSDDPPLDE